MVFTETDAAVHAVRRKPGNVTIVSYQTLTPAAVCEQLDFALATEQTKARDSYIARLTGKPDQPRFTNIELAVDRQEPIVQQR